MAKKKLEKKITFLEPEFKEVLVCQKNEKRPYLEIFVQEPENVSLENLGTLIGVFEITDNSEDSSYIVNYLISIIKKEYYAKNKRGPIESFESAMHKANLALAKLAEHGNVNWIGKMNAVCAVMEKNNIHIANTGSGMTLLVRNKTLVNITESDEDALDLNPLKTFVDVLSGRLEKNDKIVFTTGTILEIFSLEEIKRSAIKFQDGEFIQFLKTALGNELECAAVLVAKIREKNEPEPTAPIVETVSSINAFSSETFEKKLEKVLAGKKNSLSAQKIAAKETLIQELKEDLQKEKETPSENKNGHLYIKEELPNPTEKKSGAYSDYVENIKNSLTDLSAKAFDRVKDIKNNSQAQKLEKFRPQSNDYYANKGSLKPNLAFLAKIKKPSFNHALYLEKTKSLAATAIFSTKKLWLTTKNLFLFQIIRPAAIFFLEFKKKYQQKNLRTAARNNPANPEAPVQKDIYLPKAMPEAAKALRPDFSKIKAVLEKLDYTQRIYLALGVLAFFVLPYFFVQIENHFSKPEEEVPMEIEKAAPLPLEQDKNVTRIENLSAVTSTSAKELLMLNGKPFAISQNQITDIENSKDFSLPNNFQNPELTAPMDDLNLIFIIKSGKISSFSPTAGKFSDNNISVPTPEKITAAKTYLTYLYLLDPTGNQIYRYPRAEGGFGEKINWLKDGTNIENTSTMAISDNVYVASKDTVFKFFQGKKQDYVIESTATPISIYQIFTAEDMENIYILDKANSRIIKLDKDGHIISQFYNSKINSAVSFGVNEENNTIYISGDKGVEKFEMK